VAIARSLIHNPSVVLADEPTASLDTERAFQVVEIFADLIHEQNKAGIMVTHDLRMVRFVDKVIQMTDGRVARIITERADIDAMAGSSQYEAPLFQEQPYNLPIPAGEFLPGLSVMVSGD
jgi:putative ABC transport system ATP-binding protein